jgi:hypothetical protein
MKTSIFLLPSLLVVALSAWMSPAAIAADTCENVAIGIKNGTRDEIKVTKFEYFDFDKNKYRTENLFGLDGKQSIERGQTFNVTRNLGQVGNDRTKFRVTYSHKIGGNKFEPPVTEVSPAFKCSNNDKKTVFLDK